MGALRNRNIAGNNVLNSYTPPSTPTPLAAVLFTPRISGVIQISATLAVSNGSDSDTFELGAEIFSGTNLTVTGGAVTDDGWVMGTTVPPVIGGSGVTIAQVVGAASVVAGADAQITFLVFGISKPLPVGVPVAVEIPFFELGGTHSITAIEVVGLSVLELP